MLFSEVSFFMEVYHIDAGEPKRISLKRQGLERQNCYFDERDTMSM